MAETPPKFQPKKTGPIKKAAETHKAEPQQEKRAEPHQEKKAAPPPASQHVSAPKTEHQPAPKVSTPSPAPEPLKEITAAEPVIQAAEAAPMGVETVVKGMEAALKTQVEPQKEEPETIVKPISAAVKEGTTIMTDAIETTKKVAAEAKEKFQAMFGDFNEKAKAAVEKSSKIAEEVNELTKGNVEALVESGRIAAKGAEAFGQEAAEYGRKSFERATATIKSFASVKSPTEFFQLQSEFLSSAFDSFASEASKGSEAVLKLAGDVVQPISTRVAVVSEKVKNLSA